jgi:pyrroloquinoline quinone biosynthesis protein B
MKLIAGWTAAATGRGMRFSPFLTGAAVKPNEGSPNTRLNKRSSVRAMVLGTAQDGGIPQIGCRCPNCERARRDPRQARLIASLGLADLEERKLFLIDASPDIRPQVDRALGMFPPPAPALTDVLAGVLLTHAHIGHYTGLMFFGYESLAARRLLVYCSARMAEFLAANGPWNQLIRLENISLRIFKPGEKIPLTPSLTAVPIPVPHRNEYTDTFGFEIAGPARSLLYIPDIQSWAAWERSLEKALRKVDVALIDGTFFGPDDLPGRNMAEIGHPLVLDTIRRMKNVPAAERATVLFTHLNHAHPALDLAGKARRVIDESGARLAEEGKVIDLEEDFISSLGMINRRVVDLQVERLGFSFPEKCGIK